MRNDAPGSGGNEPSPNQSHSHSHSLSLSLSRSDQQRLLAALQRRLALRKRRQGQLRGFRPAAVLIPLIQREPALHLAFMQRAEDGGIHSGQIAFPGGAQETGDIDVVATALREAQEEVNILPETVTPLGLLDDNATISRYIVTPVVGVVDPPPEYTPDPREVQSIFEVPLPYLLNPENEERVPDVDFLGKRWAMYQYQWRERVIWGVTARILHDFLILAREATHDRSQEDPA